MTVETNPGKLKWTVSIKKLWRKTTPRRITTAALDIGTREIKFVYLDPDNPAVVAAARYPAPDGLFGETNGEDALCGILEEMVSEYGLAGTDVISVLGGDRVITRHIRLPKMRAGDLHRAVLAEAAKVVPLSLEEVVVRHILLGDCRDGVENQVDILFAAAPVDFIYRYHALLNRFGLILTALDLPAVALWRLYRREIFSTGVVTAILDVGAAKTILVISRGDRLQFTRTMPVGGYLLAGSLAAAYGVAFEPARDMLEHDARVLSESELAGANSAAMQMDMSLRDGLGELVREIHRSLEFYTNENNADPVERIILTGGTGKLSGFDVFLGEALNLPVQIIQPAGIEFFKPATFDPSLAVACGLALREARY